MFSRGFKDIKTKTAKFKEFPGLENKFQNSRGFKEIKDTWEPCNKRFTLCPGNDLFGLVEIFVVVYEIWTFCRYFVQASKFT